MYIFNKKDVTENMKSCVLYHTEDIDPQINEGCSSGKSGKNMERCCDHVTNSPC